MQLLGHHFMIADNQGTHRNTMIKGHTGSSNKNRNTENYSSMLLLKKQIPSNVSGCYEVTMLATIAQLRYGSCFQRQQYPYGRVGFKPDGDSHGSYVSIVTS